MHRLSRLLLLVVMLLLALPAAPAAAATAQVPSLPPNCSLSIQPDLETYLVCMPLSWNRDLVVFAHGYEFAYPASAPKLGEEQWVIQLSDGSTTSLPALVNSLGFAFATTSYSKNGLSVQEGVAEMKALVTAVRAVQAGVRNVYIIGASEGGLITTLSMERNADVFKGGLALCGPVGDFQKQINYWGDFRTAFDLLFPGLPGDAVNIPDPLMADWVGTPSSTQTGIIGALSDPANAAKVGQLLTLTQAPYDPADLTTIATTTLGILTYNVLATNEARIELGNIQPYDNSRNTALLGLGGTLYTASPNAAAAIKPYQTTGKLTKTLVTMHNVGDPIVPIWHETLYAAKVAANRAGSKLAILPINRYGHCVFKPSEVLYGFGLMLFKANRQSFSLAPVQNLLASQTNGMLEYQGLNAQFGDISGGKRESSQENQH